MGRFLSLVAGENSRWFVLAFVIAAVVTYGWLDGRDHGIAAANAQWQHKWDQQALELAQAQLHAQQVARTEELRRIEAIEEITNETRTQIERARADAAAADAVAVGLHEQARRLASRTSSCTTDTTTAIRSQAARATNAVVLADLFARADQAAGRMAAAYDRARAAGLACEHSYDAVRNARTVP